MGKTVTDEKSEVVAITAVGGGQDTICRCLVPYTEVQQLGCDLTTLQRIQQWHFVNKPDGIDYLQHFSSSAEPSSEEERQELYLWNCYRAIKKKMFTNNPECTSLDRTESLEESSSACWPTLYTTHSIFPPKDKIILAEVQLNFIRHPEDCYDLY